MDRIEGIEWYDGHDAETHPQRVKVKEIWYDVRMYQRVMKEDIETRERSVHFRCVISDNQVIIVRGN